MVVGNFKNKTTAETYRRAARGAYPVLVAEPEAVVRLALVVELSAAGMTPVGVGTAQAAIDAGAAAQFNLAIVECVFSDTEPGSIIASLKATSPGIPVICTTSFVHKYTATASGADTVVEKPYGYVHLVQYAQALAMTSRS